MKKISYILLLSLFTFFACQTDAVNTESLDTEATELKRNAATDVGVFNPIPKKAAKNLDAFLDGQLQTIAKDDPVRYGCVTFVDGYAFIDEDCTITSGVPRRYRDCDVQYVRYIECAPNYYNPYCIICAVMFVVECDDELYWGIGYDIICDYSQPVPL